ncbi:MAG: TetR/AcrR family transcriptional regulator [Alphaproteobacteria bacterium]|nr:TetR/AcrR family transcriptional regulator [Alphaproteobacteria bacterium]
MKAALRDRRRDQITDVAIEVLTERGYRDATMLEVARRASASKETLYAWFGDKQGLFEAVIRRNAQGAQAVLARHLEDDAPTELVLVDFGRALLQLLLGDGAVAINRAAISEATSDPGLAHTLSKAGREATLPSFIRFLEQRRNRGDLRMETPSEAAEDYLGLLLGDTQIRRLLGLLAAPKKAQVEVRAARAAKNFLRLYAE